MDFHTKRIGQYLEVSVTEGSTTIELGLLDKAERSNLAQQLREAADDIAPLESSDE